MRETSLPLTTPLPELSEKLDLLFNAWTKSVKEITFGLFFTGFFFRHKIRKKNCAELKWVTMSIARGRWGCQNIKSNNKILKHTFYTLYFIFPCILPNKTVVISVCF